MQFDSSQLDRDTIDYELLSKITGLVKKDNQDIHYQQRPLVKRASIPYYLFVSSPETYIMRRLYHEEYGPRQFSVMWRNAFLSFQLIYSEQQIAKTQHMSRRKKKPAAIIKLDKDFSLSKDPVDQLQKSSFSTFGPKI